MVTEGGIGIRPMLLTQIFLVIILLSLNSYAWVTIFLAEFHAGAEMDVLGLIAFSGSILIGLIILLGLSIFRSFQSKSKSK